MATHLEVYAAAARPLEDHLVVVLNAFFARVAVHELEDRDFLHDDVEVCAMEFQDDDYNRSGGGGGGACCSGTGYLLQAEVVYISAALPHSDQSCDVREVPTRLVCSSAVPPQISNEEQGCTYSRGHEHSRWAGTLPGRATGAVSYAMRLKGKSKNRPVGFRHRARRGQTKQAYDRRKVSAASSAPAPCAPGRA